MKTLRQYADEIQLDQSNPIALATILSEMSVHYSYLSEQHTAYKLKKAEWENKAKFYTMVRDKEIELDKPLSDKAVEQKWRLTTGGGKEYQMRNDIKVIEKLMSNLRSILSQRKAEQQNLGY